MRFSSEVPAALIGAAVIVLWHQLALALSGPDVNAIAKQITVRIDGQNTGSGVIIERSGATYTVLTNWHVVNSAGTYIVQTSDGRQYSVNSRQVRRLSGVDLAVLRFTSSQSYGVASAGNSDAVTEGVMVYVAGWADPGPVIRERTYQFLTGYISSRLQKPQDGYNLVYSINAAPGMSGGPVLDSHDYVVGINGRAVPDLRTGAVGFVLGIAIDTYLAAVNNLPQPRVISPPAAANRGAVDSLWRGVDKIERRNYQVANLLGTRSAPNFNHSESADAYLNQGLARYQQADIPGALAYFNQAIQLNPLLAPAYYNRGLARYKQGDTAGAIADYNQALQLNPYFAPAYNNRGLVRKYRGDTAGAIADYNQALQLNPYFAEAYTNRGIARRFLGDKAGARSDFQLGAKLFLQQGNKDDYQRVLTLIGELQQ